MSGKTSANLSQQNYHCPKRSGVLSRWDCLDPREARSLRSHCLVRSCLRVRVQWWERVRGRLQAERRALRLCPSWSQEMQEGEKKHVSHAPDHSIWAGQLPHPLLWGPKRTRIYETHTHTILPGAMAYVCVGGLCMCIQMCTHIYTNKGACRGIDRTSRRM